MFCKKSIVVYFFNEVNEMTKIRRLYNHASSRDGLRPKRSIMYSGMQYVGLIGFNEKFLSNNDNAVRPNKV